MKTTELPETCVPGANLRPGTSVTLRQPYGFPTEMSGRPFQNLGLAGQAAWDDLDGVFMGLAERQVKHKSLNKSILCIRTTSNSLRQPLRQPYGTLWNTKVLVFIYIIPFTFFF